MNKGIKPYTDKQYKSLLLREERKLIVKALRKTNNSRKQAWKLLCPKEQPYSYNALLKVIYRHEITDKEIMENLERCIICGNVKDKERECKSARCSCKFKEEQDVRIKRPTAKEKQV